jgi:hypothetical protein
MQAKMNNNVHKKLEELSLEPSDKVWKDIEQALKKRKRCYLIGWWWPLLLLSGGLLLYWGWQGNKEEKDPVVNQQQTTIAQSENPVQQGTVNVFKTDKTIENNIDVLPAKNKNNKQVDVNTGRSPVTKKNKEDIIFDSDEKINPVNKKIFSDKSSVKVKITNGSLEEAMPFTEENLSDQYITDGTIINTKDSSAITKTTDSIHSITKNIIIADKKADTLPAGKRSINKIVKNKWITRMISHAGITAFSSLGNRQNNSSYFSPSSGTSGSPLITYQQYRPGNGISMGIGMEKEKKLSEKIYFSAGLSYNFSNIKITRTVYIDSLALQSGIPMYSNVERSVHKGHLAMHSMDASLLLHYRVVDKKNPIILSAGIYNRFLFAGNWSNYKNILGKKPGYMPLLHLNPSVSYKKLTAGPYIQLGLTKIAKENNLLSYGLGIKYDVP